MVISSVRYGGHLSVLIVPNSPRWKVGCEIKISLLFSEILYEILYAEISFSRVKVTCYVLYITFCFCLAS